MADMSQHIMDEVALAVERFEEGDGDAFLVGALQELCTWLCVGGETFVRSLNVRLCLSQLIYLLDHAFSPDVRILACRALATAVDVVPRAAQMISAGGISSTPARTAGDGDAPHPNSVASGGGIEVVVNALRDDVYLLQHEVFAEELLKCLSVLTIDAHSALLQSNAHGALVTLLPVLPEQQRVLGLTCISNLFSSVGPADWESVEPAAVVLQGVFASKIADVHGALGLQQADIQQTAVTPPSTNSPSSVAPPSSHHHHHHHHHHSRVSATDEKLLITFLQTFSHLMDRIALGSTMHEEAAMCASSSSLARGGSSNNDNISFRDERRRMLTLVEDMLTPLGLLLECSEALLSRSGGGLGGADSHSAGGGGAVGGGGGGGGGAAHRNVVPNGLHIRNGVFSILTCFHNAAPRHFLDAIVQHGIIEVLTAATLRALTDNVSSLNPEAMIASASLSPQFSSALSGGGGGGRANGAGTEHQHSLTLHMKQQTLLGQDYSLSGFLEFFLFLLPVAHVTVDEFALVQPQHLWMWGDEFHNRNEYDEIVSRRLEKEYQTQRRRIGFAPVDLPMASGGGGRGVNFQQLRHVARDGSLARPIFRNGILNGFYHRKAQAMSQLCSCPLGQWGAAEGGVSDDEAVHVGEPHDAVSSRRRRRSLQQQQRERSNSERNGAATATGHGAGSITAASSTASSRRHRVLHPVDDDDDGDGGSCSCCGSIASLFKRRRGSESEDGRRDPHDAHALPAQRARGQVRDNGAGGLEGIDPDVITLHVASTSPQRRRQGDAAAAALPPAPSAHNRLPGSADAHIELFDANHHADGVDDHMLERNIAQEAVVQLHDVAELNTLAPALRTMILQHSGLSRRVVMLLIPTILTVCKSTVNAVVLRYCTALLLRTVQFLSPPPSSSATTTSAAAAGACAEPQLPASHYQTLLSIAAPYVGDVVEVLSGILRVASRGDLAQQVAIPLTIHSRDWERVFGPQPSSPVGGSGGGGAILRSVQTSYLMSVKAEMFCMASAALASLCKIAATASPWAGPTQRRIRDVVRQHRVLSLLSVASAQLYSAAAMSTNEVGVAAANTNAYAHFRCPCHCSLSYVLEEVASYAAEAMHVLSVDVLGGCGAASPVLSPVAPTSALDFTATSNPAIPAFLIPPVTARNALFVVEAETSRSAHMRHPREDSADDSSIDGSTTHQRSAAGGDGAYSISSSVAAPAKPEVVTASSPTNDVAPVQQGQQQEEQPVEQQPSPSASVSLETGRHQPNVDLLDTTQQGDDADVLRISPQQHLEDLYFSPVLGPLGAPLRELSELFAFMDVQHLALSDVFLINPHYVEGVSRRLRALEFRLSLLESDVDAVIRAAEQADEHHPNALLFALGVPAQGASHLDRLMTQIIRFVSTRASTSLGTMAYDAPLLLSLVSSTSSSSAGHGSNGSGATGYQSLLSSTAAAATTRGASSMLGGGISVTQSSALLAAIQERATRPMNLRVAPATPLGDLSPSVMSLCGPFITFAPPTTRMRASVGRQRSLRRATRSSSATMDGSTTDVLSAEEYLDVVSPCVEFELQCLPHATVLQLQREIAERLNDLPIGCQIVVAPAAAATTTTLSSISRSNTATSMDRTEPADDDNDDGEVRTEVLPPVAEQQGEPRAATPASRRGAARGAVSPDGATEEQDDTASSATDNIASQLPEAESSALPRDHRTNSGRVGQRGPAAVLMSHPFTSEYDDGILLAAPTPAPSNSARRADSREPIEDRNMANSPPPPPPATTVPVGAVSASPSRSSSPPRRARVLPDQVLVVVDGTPLMDPGMTVMDALVAYCSTTAGPFRKLVDAFLPRASSTLQQQQQHQQAMLLQATSRAHLQRAFSLWTATHSVTFAVRQQSPPASTTLATSRPVSLRVGIPRPLSREGACCPCHEYDRAAVEWERGRYYCHPAHFYPTPHDGERWVPTLPLAEGQLQRGTNSDGEEGDDQSTEGAASRAADGDPDTNKVLKSILMLGDALSSLLALCSYLAGSSHGPRGPTSTANTPAATTSAAANRVGSPAPPFPQVPATTSATTTPSSPHRQRMTASSSSGGGWNISQAPDARCLHSALIHDIQVQLPSFAIPMVAALSHVAARTDAPYDDALACVAFWGYPHLFPFELRRKLFSVLVGAHRLLVPKQFVPTTVLANHQVGAEWLESVALQRIHYLGGEGQTSASVSTPMIKKAKLSLPRDAVGTRGMELLREYANCPLHLDVEFEGEAGTGLGPTLEFFSLLATALATRAHMWLGGAAAPDEGTPHKAPQGPSATKLFPLPLLSPLSAPMTNSPTSTEPTLFERAQFFEDVGIFLSRILLDEHAVNFPLHPVFLRRLQCCPLSLEDLPTALHSVDPSLERTLSNLEAMTPESLEACDLTFVLPSDETVELQPNGRNTAVSSENVAEFCRAVRQHSLDAALRPAVECVHSAMRSTCVHPRLLQLFSSTEVGTLIGGSRGVLWDTEEALMASVSAAHGYSLKSRVVLDLVKTVVSWDAARQRSFLRFVSGSDCLPVGGLHPKLTVVRRDADPDITPSRASRIRNRSFNSTREGEDATPVSRDGVQVRTSIFGSPPPMAPRLDDTDTALTSVTPTNRRSRQLNEIGGGDTTDMEEEGIAFDRTAEAVVAEAIEASLQEPASLANASFTSSRTPVPGAAVAGFSFGAPPPVAAAPSPSTTPQHQVQSSSHLGAVIDARQELLDECLPTVNTCFHYLKLPDYSSRAVLEDRLFLAIEEGQDCFLLS